jgi:hypothetical protein
MLSVHTFDPPLVARAPYGKKLFRAATFEVAGRISAEEIL